jgi:hypothetical protein
LRAKHTGITDCVAVLKPYTYLHHRPAETLPRKLDAASRMYRADKRSSRKCLKIIQFA